MYVFTCLGMNTPMVCDVTLVNCHILVKLRWTLGVRGPSLDSLIKLPVLAELASNL